MKYFLDTNIIIYALNGKYPAIIPHFEQVPSMAIVIPTVVSIMRRRSNCIGSSCIHLM